MKRQYRIVADDYLGFEVQYSYKFWPFWIQLYYTNTSHTIERAERLIAEHIKGEPKIKVIKTFL